MGVVKVQGIIPLAEDSTAIFQLCDRYGNVFIGHDVSTIVKAGGFFQADMADTFEDRCYKVSTDAGAILFEVHARSDGKPYIVDLFSTITSQKKIISFDDIEDRNVLVNVADTINRYNNGEDIFSVEEKALLNALMSEDNQDARIEVIKENIGSNTQIIDKVLVPIDGQCPEPMTLYLDAENTAQGKINFPFINTGILIFKNATNDLSQYVSITRDIALGTMEGTYSIPASLVNTSINGIYKLGFDTDGVIETSDIRIEVC